MSDFKPVNQPITPASADPGEEFPFLHTITVVDRVVSVDNPELVQNNIRTETVTLNLDSEWDGLSCIINIGSGKTPTSLIWSGQPVIIPAELMTDIGTLNVSVVGYGDDGAVRAVTKKAEAMFTVVASGYVEDDVPLPDPTTILGQLTEAADRANQAADRFNQASEEIGDISQAVETVQTSETNAKQSETNAAASAENASQSASAAAVSAQAAHTSETNAASSVTAAQQAVDGFGLEVGITTTGEPGTDAAVEIQKTGTKYTANFTIPRGEAGPAGVNENVPLGTASGVVAQASDAYPALPRKVQVHGRTVENLWPAINKSQYNVWTCTTDETGLMHIATTTTTTTIAYFMDPIGLVPGKTYAGRVSTNPPAGVKVRVQGTSGGSVQVFGVFDADGTVFTIPGNATDITYCVACEPAESTSVNYKTRVMLVEGGTVPDVFVPSGMHTVEPEKLTVLGENLLDLSFISGNSTAKVSGDEVVFKVDVDGLNDSYTWNSVVENPFNGDIKHLIPVVPNSRLHFKAKTSEPITSSSIIGFYGSAYNLVKRQDIPNTSSNIQSLDVDVPSGAAFASVRLGVKDAEQDATITMRNICLSYTDIEYVPPEKIETNLPSDISLTDGDTLTIDRDGTTRIVHADGEPTVLENVTLPELPAPMFNVYTTGGYIQPTVDVDYEQDVNLVIQGLEAKIAALQVADKTN